MEQIKELTNCLKPCRYKKYSFAADGQKTIFGSEKYVFSLWATSKHTKVSTEQLVHPFFDASSPLVLSPLNMFVGLLILDMDALALRLNVIKAVVDEADGNC